MKFANQRDKNSENAFVSTLTPVSAHVARELKTMIKSYPTILVCGHTRMFSLKFCILFQKQSTSQDEFWGEIFVNVALKILNRNCAILILQAYVNLGLEEFLQDRYVLMTLWKAQNQSLSYKE